MMKALAVNGSPRMDKGNTGTILTPFLDGMREAGTEVEALNTGNLKLKPCSCGELYCWYKKPGECCVRDDMDQVYPKLKATDTLVLATPVYVPLPGRMQDFLNRLCALLDPRLETRAGRTRARFRQGVAIRRIALVAVCGWWEKENMDTVVRIAEELAADANIAFAGAVLRPHVDMMHVGAFAAAAGEVIAAVRKAGSELAGTGRMNPETLSAVSRPLISREDWMRATDQR
jgi:multimeric flavodoxin WrbA